VWLSRSLPAAGGDLNFQVRSWSELKLNTQAKKVPDLNPNASVEMLRRTSQAVAPLHKQSLGMDELKNAFINPEAHGFARLSRRISTYA